MKRLLGLVMGMVGCGDGSLAIPRRHQSHQGTDGHTLFDQPATEVMDRCGA